MSFADTLRGGVDGFFDGNYEIKDGRVVPDLSDLPLGKEGREMELAMLFIDMRGSTTLVDGFRRQTAAKMFKSWLWGITRIVRENNGYVRSFNGDGVLAVFEGAAKCTQAAKAALNLVWFGAKVLRPKIQAYFNNNFELQEEVFDFGIGVDVGDVLIVRAGIKGENNNDLVWVGNATNYSVKLAALGKYPSNVWISQQVYNRLNDSSRLFNSVDMWEPKIWTAKNNQRIYSSNYWWMPVSKYPVAPPKPVPALPSPRQLLLPPVRPVGSATMSSLMSLGQPQANPGIPSGALLEALLKYKGRP